MKPSGPTRAAALGSVLAILILAAGRLAAVDELGPSDATLFRLFLKDGTSLISYGEYARVNDYVVFSMPTSTSMDMPQLHLVNLAADHVDWERTDRYADTARAARYVALHGERQYAMLSIEIGQALNDVTLTQDPVKRVAIIERARKTLAEWPGYHFNYKAAEIQQMVATLDAVIAELRAAAGAASFDLSFTAGTPLPLREPLLPLPTPRESIEQMMTAARLAQSSAERLSLYSAALGAIERDAVRLSSDWRTAARATIRANIAAEVAVDRAYQALTTDTLNLAAARVKAADVRGVQQLLDRVRDRDRALGGKRPDAVLSLVAAVEAELDVARRVRLERDRWALRLPELRKYRALIAIPLDRLRDLTRQLEDIKALAGSPPEDLASIEQVSKQVLAVISPLLPPQELSGAHALLVSAAQLAGSAAYIRREAALSGNMARAWDASSAAAGALMLGSRARDEMLAVLQTPQLPR